MKKKSIITFALLFVCAAFFTNRASAQHSNIVMSVTGGNLDFGSVKLGTSATRTFTVTNNPISTGPGNITFSFIPAGGPFSVSPNTPYFQINPKNSQVFTVTFRPTTTGSNTATLNIAYNATDHRDLKIALTGVGGKK